MKRAWLAVIIFFAGGVVGFVLAWWLPWAHVRKPGSPEVQPPSADHTTSEPKGEGIWTLGRLEPAGGVVELGGIPGDRLLRLDVRQGDRVTAGMVLGQWESEVLREAEWQLAKAQLAEAEQQWNFKIAEAEEQLAAARLAEEQARKKATWELAAEQHKLTAARLALRLAEDRRNRITTVVAMAPDLLSEAEVMEADLQWERATAELEAIEAAVELVRQAGQLAVERAAAELQAAQRALDRLRQSEPLTVLRQQVATAHQRYLDSQFVSPLEGTVIRVFMEPGERVAQTPVLQIADLTRIVCVAEVPYDQIRHIRKGQIARIYSRAFANDGAGGSGAAAYLEGRVEQIAVTAALPTLRPVDPFAPAARHSVEVRISLDPQASRAASQYLYLQTDVHFLADRTADSL